ncbi:hypothetical protein C7M84_007857 [Penaeus vannamei]|uniref:Uncharacterized protein n=1 Tax=Penaeus vannamei TaxID=6689 RepID=A0A3R7QP95_PENVA|nr:hypothetical protein C7M84_007857 [Penaeus vannamei]
MRPARSPRPAVPQLQSVFLFLPRDGLILDVSCVAGDHGPRGLRTAPLPPNQASQSASHPTLARPSLSQGSRAPRFPSPQIPGLRGLATNPPCIRLPTLPTNPGSQRPRNPPMIPSTPPHFPTNPGSQRPRTTPPSGSLPSPFPPNPGFRGSHTNPPSPFPTTPGLQRPRTPPPSGSPLPPFPFPTNPGSQRASHQPPPFRIPPSPLPHHQGQRLRISPPFRDPPSPPSHSTLRGLAPTPPPSGSPLPLPHQPRVSEASHPPTLQDPPPPLLPSPPTQGVRGLAPSPPGTQIPLPPLPLPHQPRVQRLAPPPPQESPSPCPTTQVDQRLRTQPPPFPQDRPPPVTPPSPPKHQGQRLGTNPPQVPSPLSTQSQVGLQRPSHQPPHGPPPRIPLRLPNQPGLRGLDNPPLQDPPLPLPLPHQPQGVRGLAPTPPSQDPSPHQSQGLRGLATNTPPSGSPPPFPTNPGHSSPSVSTPPGFQDVTRHLCFHSLHASAQIFLTELQPTCERRGEARLRPPLRHESRRPFFALSAPPPPYPPLVSRLPTFSFFFSLPFSILIPRELIPHSGSFSSLPLLLMSVPAYPSNRQLLLPLFRCSRSL